MATGLSSSEMLALLAAMSIQSAPPQYTEPLRPQFHFTALNGWLNDPNGLVYFKGQYHLFFQHNPFGTQWGNMTWGHAVSKDLVHWQQLDEAISPDNLGTIFSGSAVVDRLDTAHFGAGALICIYTAAGGTNEQSKGQAFTQCLASSLDGKTFSKHIGNPVLGHLEAENRDPKVTWYEPAKRWIMALYLDGNRYGLFGSPNLRSWTSLSTVDMPGTSECPDFFELPIDGDAKRKKWVFWGAAGNYRVGAFDGTTFRPETEAIRSNFGNTSYAAQTYCNDPKGRRVQIAWLRGSEFPGCSWNQQMGFPTELTLRSTSSGVRLCILPVEEIKGLRIRRLKSDPSQNQYMSPSGLMDISARFKVPSEGSLTLTVNGRSIRYDARTHVLEALGKRAEVDPGSGRLDLRILVDRASIEVYAQNGLINMPLYVPPGSEATGLKIDSNGTWEPERLEVYELKSAWAKRSN
jgi:fructan beta-fructosidase